MHNANICSPPPLTVIWVHLFLSSLRPNAERGFLYPVCVFNSTGCQSAPPTPPTQYEETDKEMLVFLRPLYWKLDYKRWCFFVISDLFEGGDNICKVLKQASLYVCGLFLFLFSRLEQSLSKKEKYGYFILINSLAGIMSIYMRRAAFFPIIVSAIFLIIWLRLFFLFFETSRHIIRETK